MDQTTRAPTDPAEKEAFHRDAEERIQTFRYDKPEANGKVKQIASLLRSDLIRINVQVVKEGGENNMHYHTGGDNAWMVLKGCARFYGLDDKLLGELHANDGILLPGGSRYWFEKVGDEDLEILQIMCKESRTAKTARINLEEHKDWMTDGFLQVYDKAAT